MSARLVAGLIFTVSVGAAPAQTVSLPAGAPALVAVGVARIDITPTMPIRLHGFPREADRIKDVTAVAQRIHAKAIAIGIDVEKPVLIVTADLLGVSAEMKTELLTRLKRTAGFDDPARLTLAATHTHSAPAVSSVAPYVFRQPPTAEQAAHIREYGEWLMGRLEQVALEALQSRRPSRLEYARGTVDFAINRRVIKDGKWTGFGINPDGAVDHDLPMLTVRGADNAVRAVWLSYACHGISWHRPSVHGDWMGSAQQMLEAEFPGAVAMITIGCAGDQSPRVVEGNDVDTPAAAITREAKRLLAGPQKQLPGPPQVRLRQFDLPLAPREEIYDWAKQKDWFSQAVAQKQTRGEALPRTIPYAVQTWTFGEALAMVFLAGEVTVEYGLRLKREFDGGRLWVNAYANATPAYIPSRRMIPEGGWEVDGSRLNYGLAARVAPELEETIVQAVHQLVPAAFARPAGATAPPGETKTAEWWKNNGHPKGQWWLTYPGYEGAAADKIWERVPIPPSPVLTPEAALQSLAVPDGLRVELVAAEPLVVRPVHMKFDAAGRLWVVEMTGYMRDIDASGENDPTGRVVVLEDRDGDGRMDKATTFLSGLVMPRTIAFVAGGVLVVEPPKIWYARDTNGDLVCDEKTEVAADFGEAGNPEHSANGLMPAIDNWMYSAKSAVRHRWEAGKLVAEPTLFRGQWGIAQDDAGRLYYNYNASPLHTELVPGQYLMRSGGTDFSRQRNLRGKLVVNVPIIEDKSLHPPRVTPLVTLGASDLRPDGTLKQFTSACAPFIFRGHGLPAEFHGNAFVCDPVGNLVSRFMLEAAGPDRIARRAYPNREFLTSTDERFRPVALETGPDGALYVADMYTVIVEHKKYVTEYLRNQVLTRGVGEFNATGRIYRIVPATANARPPAPLAGQTPAQWVQALSSDNGWERDTAQRLLVERRDAAIVPALKALVATGARPLGRLHALWTCDGLGAIDFSTVRGAMRDADPRVRVAALRLSERFLPQEAVQLAGVYRALAVDPDPEVGLQLLLSVGESAEAWAYELLGDLLRRPGAWWLPSVAATALNGRELEFFERVLNRPDWKMAAPDQAMILEQLGTSLIQQTNAARLGRLFALLAEKPRTDWRVAAVIRGAAAIKRVGRPVEVGQQPMLLKSLAASGDQEDRRLAEALASHVTWGGEAGRKAPAVAPLTPAEQARFAAGRANYALICAACHQPNGQGLAGVAPSLVDSPYVNGPAAVPINIVLHGLTGPIEVNGEKWNLMMPGFASTPAVLDDGKIADVLTYIRREWGNQASAVTPAQVTAQRRATAGRTEPWTTDGLKTLAPGPIAP